MDGGSFSLFLDLIMGMFLEKVKLRVCGGWVPGLKFGDPARTGLRLNAVRNVGHDDERQRKSADS